MSTQPRSRSVSQVRSDDDYDSPRPQSRSARRRRQRRNNQQQQGGGGLADGLPAVNEVNDTVNQVTSTAKGLTNTVGGAVGGGGEGASGKDTLRLRLDLNIDVYLKLEARVHGDLTLALL